MKIEHVTISQESKQKLRQAAAYLYTSEKNIVELALDMFYDKRRITNIVKKLVKNAQAEKVVRLSATSK